MDFREELRSMGLTDEQIRGMAGGEELLGGAGTVALPSEANIAAYTQSPSTEEWMLPSRSFGGGYVYGVPSIESPGWAQEWAPEGARILYDPNQNWAAVGWEYPETRPGEMSAGLFYDRGPQFGMTEEEAADFPHHAASMYPGAAAFLPQIARHREQTGEEQFDEDWSLGKAALEDILSSGQLGQITPEGQAAHEDVFGNLQRIAAEWERRGGDDYDIVSMSMLQPAINQAIAAGADYTRTAQGQMAARGLGRSGASASMAGHGAGMTRQGIGEILGGAENVNALARVEALGQAGEVQGALARINRDWEGMHTARDMLEARTAEALTALNAAMIRMPGGDPYEDWAFTYALTRVADAEETMAGSQASYEAALDEAEYGLGDAFWDIVGGVAAWSQLGR